MEGTSFKRPRVTEDILSYSSKLTSADLKDTTKDKLTKISAQVEKLEAEKYSLQNQIEWSNRTHEYNTKENARQITDLIKEKNEIKARVIQHKARADEAAETLQIMKAKHIEVTNELRAKNADYERQLRMLKVELEEHQIEAKRQKIQVENMKESHQLQVKNLEKTIEMYKEANENQSKKIESISKRELEYIDEVSKAKQHSSSNITAEKSQKLYDNLTEQYCRVCKLSEKLESENSKLSSELKHYKGISQNVELLREERNSLKDKLNTLDEVKNSKFLLEVENANLIAERESWARYLDNKPEYNTKSPASIIVGLAKDANESKYLKREVELLQQELQNQYKFVGSLEDHIDDLKKTVLENERSKSLSSADHLLFNKREEILKKHITILQDQLRLYDSEEKHNMESTYDQNKTLRIAQLEMFLREIENQFKTQAQEVVKSIQSTISVVPVQTSAGPYEKLTSGMKIVDFLQQMNKEKERYVQELISANAKSFDQPQQEHISTSTTIPQDQQQEHRILQLNDNPESTTKAIRKELLTRLEKENQDLLKLQIGDASADTVTMPSSSYTNMQKQLAALEKRNAHILAMSKNRINDAISRIREVWGYHIIIRLDGCIRLESVFVDKSELAFLVKDEDDGSILRIVGSKKDKYMDLLDDIYQTYISTQGNVSAFLNAAYLELYMQSKQNEDNEERAGNYMNYDDEMNDNEEEEPMEGPLYERGSVVYENDPDSAVVYQPDNEEVIVYENDEEEDEETEEAEEGEADYEEENYEEEELEYDEGEYDEELDDTEEVDESNLQEDDEEEGYDFVDEEEGEVEYGNVTQQGEPSAILLVDSDSE